MAVKKIGGDMFDAVIGSGDKVLVDFFATWCGPCKFMSPVLDEISEELGAGKEIIKVDIDENQELAAKFMVTAVPTLVLFQDGKELGRLVGVNDADSILELFDK